MIYIVMNKPAGYVCSAVSDSHKTIYSLLTPELQSLLNQKRGARLHTIGRLDCETSGLIFLTTDGYFSNYLTRPENHVSKKYLVTLRDPVSKQEQETYAAQFSKGVILPAEKKSPETPVGPAQIDFLSQNQCVVTISEGKFHQVRRMFLAVKNEVIELKRIAIGSYSLPQNLAEGQYLIFDKAISVDKSTAASDQNIPDR